MESMRHFEELQRQNWNHLSTQQNSDYVGWPVSQLREQHVPSYVMVLDGFERNCM